MGTFPTTSLGACEANRISALCFTACPRNGVLQSSDDTLLCNFARGLSPQRRWENAPCVCAVKPNRALSAKGRLRSCRPDSPHGMTVLLRRTPTQTAPRHSGCASTWFEKEHKIKVERWPVAYALHRQKTLRNRRLHCNVSDQTHNKGGAQKISMNMTRQKGMSIPLSKTESEKPPLARKVMVPVSVAKQEFDAAVGTDASKGRMGQTLAGRCPQSPKRNGTHGCGADPCVW